MHGSVRTAAQRVPRLRPGRWCNFPGFERRIVAVESHRGMVSENRSK